MNVVVSLGSQYASNLALAIFLLFLSQKHDEHESLPCSFGQASGTAPSCSSTRFDFQTYLYIFCPLFHSLPTPQSRTAPAALRQRVPVVYYLVQTSKLQLIWSNYTVLVSTIVKFHSSDQGIADRCGGDLIREATKPNLWLCES